MIIREHDTVPLPAEEITEMEPVELTLRDHPCWPDRTLHLYMDWNPVMEKWVWHVESEENNRNALQRVIQRQPVLYGKRYYYQDYFMFVFLDLSRSAKAVTPKNLGDTVELVGYPGPNSPGWADWVSRQAFDSDEEREAWLAEGAVFN